MFALGCIQSLQCNKNTCPTGITTHDKELQEGLVPEDKCKRVAAYARQLAYSVGIIAHSCGVTEPRGLQRHHMRVIERSDKSHGMHELDPIPPVRAEYATGVSQVDSETSHQAGGSMPLINTMAIDTLDKNYRKQDTGKVP